jgi:Helix-hairpin-helix motif
LINKGDDKALEAIPGIGEVKAANIKKARPFKAVDDLIMVDGVGEATFDGIVKWAQEGTPAAGAKPAAEPAATKETKPSKPAAQPKADAAKSKKPS